jgi:hypothetical protein
MKEKKTTSHILMKVNSISNNLIRNANGQHTSNIINNNIANNGEQSKV